jgi:hypothetical protein
MSRDSDRKKQRIPLALYIVLAVDLLIVGLYMLGLFA